MRPDELENLLDELEIGDPGLVSTLDREIEDFREDLVETEPETLAHLVATASLFREQVKAYDLLRRVLPLIEDRPGGLPRFYEEQERVWRGRRNKSHHDVEYLRIVLGVRDSMPEKPARGKDKDIDDDLGGEGDGMAALLKEILGGADEKD